MDAEQFNDDQEIGAKITKKKAPNQETLEKLWAELDEAAKRFSVLYGPYLRRLVKDETDER